MPLSSLTQRRLALFRANRRGYFSFWIFTILMLMSSGAELIANHKPLLVSYQGRWFVPFLVDYTDATFGGDLETTVSFQDPEIVAAVNRAGWILWAPIRFDGQAIDTTMTMPSPAPPSRYHWLGTDDQGRDVAARVIYGFRTSAYFAVILTALALLIGVSMGAIQGYAGGWLDLMAQRATEIWSGLPIFYVLLILSGVMEPSVIWLLLIMTLFSWMGLSSVVRAEFLRARTLDYVRAARALGVPTLRIMRKHVLPNAIIATLTLVPFMLNGAISTLTSLDFLGMGLPPGSASLGELVAQGKNNLHAPWLAFTSFVVMTLLLSLLIFIGEAARDAFDPRRALTRDPTSGGSPK